VREGTKPLNPLATRIYPGPDPNLPDGGPLVNHEPLPMINESEGALYF
jgi:hypothetical protein